MEKWVGVALHHSFEGIEYGKVRKRVVDALIQKHFDVGLVAESPERLEWMADLLKQVVVQIVLEAALIAQHIVCASE